MSAKGHKQSAENLNPYKVMRRVELYYDVADEFAAKKSNWLPMSNRLYIHAHWG